jgi:hypothetical protein
MIRDLVLIAFAAAAFALWGLPNLKVFLAYLLARRVKCEFESDAARVDPAEYPAATQQLIAELAELGFRPLGVRSERRPFVYVRGLDYVHPAGQTFASLHAGVKGLELGRASFYFYTPYKDGAVVITSSAPIPPFQNGNFMHGGYPGKTPGELYDLHRKRVDRMTAQGHEPCDQFDQAARVRATHAYYANPASRQMESGAAMKCLGNFAGSAGLLVLSVLFFVWRHVL